MAQTVESKSDVDDISAGMQNGDETIEDKKDAINANQEQTNPTETLICPTVVLDISQHNQGTILI